MRYPITKPVRMWALGGVVVAALVFCGGYGLVHLYGEDPSDQDSETPVLSVRAKPISVQVVLPRPGGMDRTTTQPCTVQAFGSVDLQAAVNGYLKTLNVDIGAKVKDGDVLAIIEVPELDKQLDHQMAVVDQKVASVAQMRATKVAVTADLNAAKASVKQAKAAVDSAKATLDYRERRFKRYTELAAKGTIAADVRDEAQEYYEAAAAAERAANETVAACESRVEAVNANIVKAAADIDAAVANVAVANADVEKTQELLKYATITAPFDGVITRRNVFKGNLIRAATGGTTPTPMFTIDKTDTMRVVIQVPDRDAPFADPGDEATIEFVTLPGQKFKAPIARIADSEESQTRTMRVEVDLPNPTGKLFQGMYGYATITLEKSANVLALPSSCVINKKDKMGKVFVVHGDRAVLIPVGILAENGVDVGVVGLKENEQVVLNPRRLTDGARVTVAPPKKDSKRS